jgi:predicted outer membrane repeat protein
VAAVVTAVVNPATAAITTTIIVPDDASTIQAAIDMAAQDDLILVRPGVYFERIDLIGKQLTLRAMDGPDVTTIDGEAGGSVITCATAEGRGTVIDGFTITNGLAVTGGGLKCVDTSPTIRNCVFADNHAAISITTRGGGAYFRYSDADVADCVFRNNRATGSLIGQGGGLYNDQGSMLLARCTFIENEASHHGGGVGWRPMIDAPVSDCVFIGNTAGLEGGGMVSSAPATITRCRFDGNDAGVHGGGLWNWGPTEIARCTFVRNEAECGGGMYDTLGDHTITDCVFYENAAHDDGGGLFVWATGATGVDGCTFEANVATKGDGGGIHSGKSGVVVVSASLLCLNLPDDVYGAWQDDGENVFTCCRGDVNEDGVVGFGDLLRVLAAWGPTGGPEDLDYSGVVDFDDLLVVLAAWGPCE